MDATTTTAQALLGAKVQILKTPAGCCGVLRFGHEGIVKEVLEHPDGNICILEDDALVREQDIIILEYTGQYT